MLPMRVTWADFFIDLSLINAHLIYPEDGMQGRRTEMPRSKLQAVGDGEGKAITKDVPASESQLLGRRKELRSHTLSKLVRWRSV